MIRTRSPSWSHQSPPLAWSDSLWSGSQSTSLWQRSRPRQCNTSCQSAPALQLARVAPDLCRFPSLQRQCHWLPSQKPSLCLETDLIWLDTACLLRATDPGPGLCWIQLPRHPPDLRKRKRKGPGPAVARPTTKLPWLNLLVSSGCRVQGPCKCHQWVEQGSDLGYGLQKEGGLDWCFQHELGSSVRRPTVLRPVVEGGRKCPHQLPGNASSVPSPSCVFTGPEGAPHSGPLG